MENIGFRVTAEFDCSKMMSEQTFHDDFGSDPMAAYESISDHLADGPWNYSEAERIVSVKLLPV